MNSEIRNQKSPVRRRCFSLIELMVAVGIITLLVGLTVGITAAISANAELREAQDILKLLDMASDEYERFSERQLTYGFTFTDSHGIGHVFDFDQNAYGWSKDRDKAALPRKFLEYMLHNAQSAAIIAKINNKRVRRDNETDTYSPKYVVDPWGTTIRVIFPGRPWDANYSPPDAIDTRDLDGTVRTDEEELFGICVNGKINFVSYGPDGKAGSVQLDKTPDQRDPRKLMNFADNVYAYPPLREVPVQP